MPIGFEYNGVQYYYVTNLQGDIIAILDTNGTCVAEYSYDAWGNCTIDSDTNGIAEINPLRYRGYYFDSDTGLYYLQSRYYDSNIGRFVNSDTPLIVAVDAESLFQYNIFAYCNNNPISYVDHCGEDAIAAQYYYEFIAALSAAGAAIAPAAIAVGGIALIAVGIYDISSSVSYASKSNSGAESTNPRKYNGTTSNKKPKVTKSNGKKVKPKIKNLLNKQK